MSELLYTVSEVARLLKTKPEMVYKLMNKGLLPYMVIGRRKVRATTLEAFLAKYEGYDITDPENIQKIEIEGEVDAHSRGLH